MLLKVTKKIKVKGKTKTVLKVHRNQRVNDASNGFKGRAKIANLNSKQSEVDMKTKQKNMDAAELKAKKLTDLAFEQRHARTMAIEISLKKADMEKVTKMKQRMRQNEQREMDKKTAEMDRITRKESTGKKVERIKEVSMKVKAKHEAATFRSKESQQKKIDKAKQDTAMKSIVSRRRRKNIFRRWGRRRRKKDDKKMKKQNEKERRNKAELEKKESAKVAKEVKSKKSKAEKVRKAQAEAAKNAALAEKMRKIKEKAAEKMKKEAGKKEAEKRIKKEKAIKQINKKKMEQAKRSAIAADQKYKQAVNELDRLRMQMTHQTTTCTKENKQVSVAI